LGNGYKIGHSYFFPKDGITDDQFVQYVIDHELVHLVEEYWYDEKDKQDEICNGMRKIVGLPETE
jgi:5-methylcytosine-specific restriction protein B